LKKLQDIARSREHESYKLTMDAAVIRDVVKVAAAIKNARREKGWNQQELATAMGTTQRVVARLENPGEDRMPNLSTILKAINSLGIDFYLVTSLEDARQAMAEMVQSQQPKA
jgi:transcriptional regulator with XRE-family HTH domain